MAAPTPTPHPAKRLIDRATILILLVAVAAYVARLSRTSANNIDQLMPVDSGILAEDTVIRIAHDLAYDIASTGDWIGSPDLPVSIVVFFDYTCGFCGEFSKTLLSLRDRYPEYVALSIKHWYSRPTLSRTTSLAAARCSSDQGRFQQFHVAALSRPDRIRDANGWLQIASEVEGLNLDTLRACVRSRRHHASIERDLRHAAQLKVDATPISFLNGRPIVGAVGLATLDSMVAYELGRNK